MTKHPLIRSFAKCSDKKNVSLFAQGTTYSATTIYGNAPCIGAVPVRRVVYVSPTDSKALTLATPTRIGLVRIGDKQVPCEVRPRNEDDDSDGWYAILLDGDEAFKALQIIRETYGDIT